MCKGMKKCGPCEAAARKAKKIAGMAKKRTYRRRRVSGVTTGLFTKKTLIPATVTVAADYFLGSRLPILQTQKGAIGQAVIGGVMAFTNIGGRGATKKGVGLAFLGHGLYKLGTKKDLAGNAIAGIGAGGYSYFLNNGNQNPAMQMNGQKRYV